MILQSFNQAEAPLLAAKYKITCNSVEAFVNLCGSTELTGLELVLCVAQASRYSSNLMQRDLLSAHSWWRQDTM